MIRAIQQFFDARLQPATTPGSSSKSEHALHLAAAALLIEMTRSDFEVKQEERRAVADGVRRVLGLSAEETAELMRLAELEAQESVSLFDFTRLINKGFPPEIKEQIVELLWRVAFADGEVDRHEEHLVRKIANLIHVSHKAFIAAKQRARAHAPGSPS